MAATATGLQPATPAPEYAPVSAAIEQLRRLRRLGFRAAPLLDGDGGLEALYLARECGGVRDAVIAYSEVEVLAYRTSADWDAERPFHLDPEAVHWRRHGELVGVTNLLLALPMHLSQHPTGSQSTSDEPPEH